jgi:hypothetical protein
VVGVGTLGARAISEGSRAARVCGSGARVAMGVGRPGSACRELGRRWAPLYQTLGRRVASDDGSCARAAVAGSMAMAERQAVTGSCVAGCMRKRG